MLSAALDLLADLSSRSKVILQKYALGGVPYGNGAQSPPPRTA